MGMLGSLLLCLAWLGAVPHATAYKPAPTTPTDLLAAAALVNQGVYELTKQVKCNVANSVKRREWSTLSVSDRKAYTSAVLCLTKLPPKSDPAVVPGARSRYDDFLATHIMMTPVIHGTANFLSWHRYFTWAYEKALRDECHYQGYQPYWNWGKSAFDQVNSPYFDGSDGSMSGDGISVPHEYSAVYQQPPPNPAGPALPPAPSPLPPGNGGGCLKSGPFKDMKVNLGPVGPTFPGDVPNGNGLSYNPRCIRRDIITYLSERESKDSDSFRLITQSKDFGSFSTTLQGNFTANVYGVHGAGHFTFAGDPGGDVFVSPGDPMFFLHHAQIDRTWWMWQNLDPKGRYNQLAGTITGGNMPPSRDGTLDDLLDLGVSGPPPIKIRDAVDTLNGPFCYTYV